MSKTTPMESLINRKCMALGGVLRFLTVYERGQYRYIEGYVDGRTRKGRALADLNKVQAEYLEALKALKARRLSKTS